LEDWFTQSIFTYANVPYRHKTYEELIQNPHDAIAFDQQKHDICLKLEKEIGSDGKLIQDEKGTLKANLIEKLLVPLYSKLSNFVPEAGIWMNTQRPEWNDANNALVGIGASMVTLYYMRRYVSFLERLINKATTSTWTIHAEVKQLFSQINQVFFEHETVLQTDIDDLSRKTIMDALGKAGSAFRSNVYDGLSGAKDQLEKAEVIKALEKIKLFIDHSITRNKRSDGLFHAYNLILIQSDNVGIRRLNEMLEGQVSVLSSGYLNADQTLELLNKLRASKLYRNDQQSYILYPNKKLPNLLDKNKFTTSELESSKLLQQLLEQGNTDIILKDHKGIYHFNGEINNASKLAFELNQIESNIENLDEEKKYILDLYEKLFDHESFTGRSGTFYKFEGLGCIYWHMVSKLLLAVAENISLAEETSNDLNVLEKLKEHYKQIRNGIGSHKSPKEYGAFPTDPYSHTPSMSGVQQPGMTGQVKEDLLSRMHELGISVNDGCVHFEAQKVNSEEFITEEIEGNSAFLKVFPVAVPKGVPYLAFTYCNVPVIYQKSDSDKIRLSIQNKETIEILDHKLDMELSSILFKRKAEIEKIEVLFTSKNKKR
nr:hypothetical protein [Prolixibacteraceae bacterium]